MILAWSVKITEVGLCLSLAERCRHTTTHNTNGPIEKNDRFDSRIDWPANLSKPNSPLRLFGLPSLLDAVKPTTYETREETVRGMYKQQSLKGFAEFLGLVEIDRSGQDWLGLAFKLRKTPLLGDAVRFHLQA